MPLEPTSVANPLGRSLIPEANARSSSWLDRLLALRDRVLSSPRFQRWAAGFPLTRPIARRRARALFDVCAGFVYSQVLFACVQVRLFDALREQPMTVDALSARLSMSVAATHRLLAAAVSLRLVERRTGARFGLGALGAAIVGNPGIAAMVEHHALLYGDLQDPVALLRGERRATSVGRFWPYAEAETPDAASAADVAAYSSLMSVSQAMLADDVIDAYPIARHHCLLDVGGGEGTFLATVAVRAPRLQLLLFDLPAVAARAEARFAALGLADRALAVGGDFCRDRLPPGADVVSLIRVLHDHDDPSALLILRAIHAALPPGGTLLVAEPMSASSGSDPVGDAYFGFYLMAMGSGRPRQPTEISDLLAAAGFRDIEAVRTRQPMLTRLIVGRR